MLMVNKRYVLHKTGCAKMSRAFLELYAIFERRISFVQFVFGVLKFAKPQISRKLPGLPYDLQLFFLARALDPALAPSPVGLKF